MLGLSLAHHSDRFENINSDIMSYTTTWHGMSLQNLQATTPSITRVAEEQIRRLPTNAHLTQCLIILYLLKIPNIPQCRSPAGIRAIQKRKPGVQKRRVPRGILFSKNLPRKLPYMASDTPLHVPDSSLEGKHFILRVFYLATMVGLKD